MGRLLSLLAGSLDCDNNRGKSFSRTTNRCAPTAENFSMSSRGINPSDRLCVTNNISTRGQGSDIAKPVNESTNSKAMPANYESDPSSKPFLKTWMRKVLRKENGSSKPDGRPALFRRRYRTRRIRTNVSDGKSSPTNSKTVTDESSSQYCRSRSDESPRGKLLTVQIEEAYHGSINSTGVHTTGYENNHDFCCNDICENQQNKNINANDACQNCRSPFKQRSLDIGEEEIVNDDEFQKFSFKKSEIINNLFPMGYPNTPATKNSSGGEVLNFVARDDRKDTSKPLDSPIKKCCEVTIGDPEYREKKEPKRTFQSVQTDSASPSSVDYDCDKFIGLVISFDPTWDLLASGPKEINHTAGMVKSRLQKFHDIENYADSLLGQFSGEESSHESTNLVADINLSFGTEALPFRPRSMLKEFMAEGKSSNTFELGYHFDHKRFPTVYSSEVEICFYPDEASIECLEDFTDIKGCKTLKMTEKNPKLQKDSGLLLYSEESGNPHSICSIDCNDNFYESVDFIDSECNMLNPIDAFVRTKELHSLPYMSSPQQSITLHNLYLFTDKDENEHTEYESWSTKSTQIGSKKLREQQRQSPYMPHLGCLPSPLLSHRIHR